MSTGEWIPVDQAAAYYWDMAEIRRMNRRPEDRAALYTRVAKQRVRFILTKLRNR